MEIKLFEILDRATCMPVMAIKIYSNSTKEYRILRRAGFGDPIIAMMVLSSGDTKLDPYSWGNFERTRSTAHHHIRDNWDNLVSGDSIDIEYVLKEVSVPKPSEINWQE